MIIEQQFQRLTVSKLFELHLSFGCELFLLHERHTNVHNLFKPALVSLTAGHFSP